MDRKSYSNDSQARRIEGGVARGIDRDRREARVVEEDTVEEVKGEVTGEEKERESGAVRLWVEKGGGGAVRARADNILHQVRSSNTSASKRSPDILEDASP